MAFDFKKEYKEFYMPQNVQQIVTVPAVNYIAVRGQGDLQKWKTVIRHPIKKMK